MIGLIGGFYENKMLYYSPDRSGNPCGLGFSPQDCSVEQD